MNTRIRPFKPKPKEPTPPRRAATASRLIWFNPTPTRSEIQPVLALSTAERYDFQKLRDRFPSSAQSVHEVWWIPKYGKGKIFAPPNNGSFVCWGLSETEVWKFAEQILAFQGARVGQLKEPETEELDFVMDPSGEIRLQDDLIILGKDRVRSMLEILVPPYPSPCSRKTPL